MSTRANLLVIYTERLEECRAFYAGLGLEFASEQHGNGPAHCAAVMPDGMVLELYPATSTRRTGALRLGFTVPAGALPPGKHLLDDPDGRKVQVLAR